MNNTKQRTKKTVAILMLFALITTFIPLHQTQAMAFNPNYIISDSEMRNAYAMDFSQIYSFLNEKGGLNTYFDVDAEDGLLKGTAQLIDDAAKRYNINPKYIISVLQKESSVIQATEPTEKQLDWAAGYALCDGCYKNSELAQKYKGFAKQIDAAAGWMDWFMTNAPTLSYLKQPGITYTISSTDITPMNLATAGLYNYTPHLHGNKLFWNIWQRWFGDGVGDIALPDGTLIKNEDSGSYAFIQGGKFRPITSLSVLETRFNNRTPIVLTETMFRMIEESNPGKPISLPDLAIVRDETNTLYLIVGEQRRPFADEQTFATIGYNPEEVEDVTTADIEEYKIGATITTAEAFPLGQLIQDTATGGVYYVESNIRHAIWDKAILKSGFGDRSIKPMSTDEINNFTLGEPVILPDGTLVKTPDNPTVWVISEGKRRLIPTEDVFFGYGYQFTSVIECGEKALFNLHPEGEPLLLISEEVTATAIGI